MTRAHRAASCAVCAALLPSSASYHFVNTHTHTHTHVHVKTHIHTQAHAHTYPLTRIFTHRAALQAARALLPFFAPHHFGSILSSLAALDIAPGPGWLRAYLLASYRCVECQGVDITCILPNRDGWEPRPGPLSLSSGRLCAYTAGWLGVHLVFYNCSFLCRACWLSLDTPK
jgi:hypothetical protein